MDSILQRKTNKYKNFITKIPSNRQEITLPTIVIELI